MKRIKEERFIYHSSAACCCRSIGSLLYQLLMQLDTEPWKKISLIRNIFDQNPGRKYLWSEISLIRNIFDQNIVDQKYLWSEISLIRNIFDQNIFDQKYLWSEISLIRPLEENIFDQSLDLAANLPRSSSCSSVSTRIWLWIQSHRKGRPERKHNSHRNKYVSYWW